MNNNSYSVSRHWALKILNGVDINDINRVNTDVPQGLGQCSRTMILHCRIQSVGPKNLVPSSGMLLLT